MKKILGICIVLLSASLVFSQTAPASLSNGSTASLFGNQFDAQFQVNPNFGLFDQQFLYGGLGNPQQLAAGKNGSGTFVFGYYKPGTIPFSIFTTIAGGRPITRTGKWTQTTAGGITTTSSPVGLFLLQESSIKSQFITAFNAGIRLVMGGQVNYSHSVKSSNPDNFRKTTVKNGANTTTREQWNTDATNGTLESQSSTHDFTIAVPVAFMLGDLKNTAKISLSGEIEDGGGYFKESTGGNTRNFKYIKKTSNITTRLGYKIAIPAKDVAGGEWYAGTDISFGVKTKKDENKQTTNGNTTSIVNKYAPNIAGGIMIRGGRSFEYKPVETFSFKIKPEATFDYKGTPGDPSLISNTTTTGGTTTTTNGPKLLQKVYRHTIETKIEIPMAMIVKFNNSQFGLKLGATPILGASTQIDYDQQPEHGQKGYHTVSVKPILSETHTLGLFIDLPAGVRLDISMNGSDITAFEDLTAQVFIPLGK